MTAVDEIAVQHVLVVDDDPLNRLLLTSMLTALGARVDEAASGAEAWRTLTASAFDRVLMDIHMPGMSGLELTKKLRTDPGPNREVPVVAVSGDTAISLKQYRQLGFDGFLEKPISFGALQANLTITRCRDDRPAQP